MNYRIENDTLGIMEISDDKYFGIHTARALENFNISNNKTHSSLIKAIAMVKKAAVQANFDLKYLNLEKSQAIQTACDEILNNDKLIEKQFIVDALQGGAGTSTNMNVNEVIANLALENHGFKKGDYLHLHPIEDVNLHQSTNDVYPTALKIASIYGVRELSSAIAELQGSLQLKEKEFAHIVSIGRTELQDAVPITLGSQFSSFADAIARDRWRTFKCEERLRVVNIGGTAVGTGLTAPQKYIFLVIEKLRQITGLGLTRAENPMEQTANNDVFIEVSGMLTANAASIMKIARDLRLLHYLGEIKLPALQAGSSIMPGKVNPVICESAISAAIQVQAYDAMIKECVSLGTLQINEFLPLIAYSLLESIYVLKNTNLMLSKHISNITANENICLQNFEKNDIIITAFLPVIGYEKAEELLHEFRTSKKNNLKEFLEEKLGKEIVDKILSPGNLMSLGFK